MQSFFLSVFCVHVVSGTWEETSEDSVQIGVESKCFFFPLGSDFKLCCVCILRCSELPCVIMTKVSFKLYFYMLTG